MFYIYVGTGEWRETYHTTQVELSIKSIQQYTVKNIAPKSVFEDLLIEEYDDGNRRKLCWELQWLHDPKGDKHVTKYGKHSNKHGAPVRRDATLEDIPKQRQGIHLQIVFNAAKFDEWEQRQESREKLPICKIIRHTEDDKHLKIEINYPQKQIYRVCYKIYESIKKARDTDEIVWNELEYGTNEILLSNLWQFKKYTIEISIKNLYSNVYGKSMFKSGYEMTSHKIRFDGSGGNDGSIRNDDGDNDSDDLKILSLKQGFEKHDHDAVHRWCKHQLKSSDVFTDIRHMKNCKITISWILKMIEGFKELNGDLFLRQDLTDHFIVSNLLKVETAKKYRVEQENDNNRDCFGHHLFLSILSRLRIMAFKQETKLGYIPNNKYVVYFWCFFRDEPKNDIFIRCREIEFSLVHFLIIVSIFILFCVCVFCCFISCV